MGLIAKIEEKLSSSNKSGEATHQERSFEHTKDSAHPAHPSDGHISGNTQNSTANVSPVAGSSHLGSHAGATHSSHIHPAVRGDTTQANDLAGTHNSTSVGHSGLVGSGEALSSGVSNTHHTAGTSGHTSNTSHGLNDNVQHAGLAGTNVPSTNSSNAGHGLPGVRGVHTHSSSANNGLVSSEHSQGVTGSFSSHHPLNSTTSHGPADSQHEASHNSSYGTTSSSADPNAQRPGGPHANKENYDAIPEAGGVKVGSGPFEHDRSYDPVASGHSHGQIHSHTNKGNSTVQAHGQPSLLSNKHDLVHEQSQSTTARSTAHSRGEPALASSKHGLAHELSNNEVDRPHVQSHSVGHSHDQASNGTVHHQSDLRSGLSVDQTGRPNSGAASSVTPSGYSQSMAQHQADQMMR